MYGSTDRRRFWISMSPSPTSGIGASIRLKVSGDGNTLRPANKMDLARRIHNCRSSPVLRLVPRSAWPVDPPNGGSGWRRWPLQRRYAVEFQRPQPFHLARKAPGPATVTSAGLDHPCREVADYRRIIDDREELLLRGQAGEVEIRRAKHEAVSINKHALQVAHDGVQTNFENRIAPPRST